MSAVDHTPEKGEFSNGDWPRVAVVGAGLAGLACAVELRRAGFPVRVLEKGRGAGGRQSTRRVQLPGGRTQFDHGAQYFTVRDLDFAAFVAPLRRGASPLVQAWEAPVLVLRHGTRSATNVDTERFVFVPGMNALTRRLAAQLSVHFDARVARARREGGVWILRGEDESTIAEAEVLVSTAPADQTLEMLPADLSLRPALEAVRYAPCWALMAHFERPLGLDLGGAFVEDSPLSWVCHDGSKPGRPDGAGGESWVLHASSEWSSAHIDESPERVTEALLHAFRDAAGIALPATLMTAPHRWRYALPTVAIGEPCLWDTDARIGVAGDACPEGARVEGAFVSGRRLAHRIASDLSLAA